MNAKSKIPAIRFDGFSEEWEEKKIEKVVDVRSGRDYKHLTHGDIPVFGTGGYMLSVNEALSYDENAIGIGRKGTIDKPYILKAPFWTVDTLFYAVPRAKNNLGFVYAIFQKINWRQKDESTGVPSLSKVAINSIEVSVTFEEEQTKIGNYFQQLDTLIAQHQKKHDKLLNLKKALLEKLFPKQGTTKPEIRFKGFSGEWEEKVLGDVSESFSGGTPQVGISEYYDGEIPFIRSAEINSESTELFISEEGLKNSSAKVVNTGVILYALYGATSGEVGRSRINGAINQAILAILPNTNVSSGFVMHWLRKNKSKIIGVYLQGGQGNLSGTIVKNLEIHFPNYNEQTKIGNLFKQLDTLITQHQTQLKKLNNIKQACLEKMFV